ncbi:unnamed protein product [Vicia faba]|uniref:Uncharacterized protein n=1 Tax=Vicia faba TaxID=3906 RepID=A0AAV1AE43_VICFA|nr:unnamed protein product [Vicia faba]
MLLLEPKYLRPPISRYLLFSLAFTSIFDRILLMMSGNPIIIESDSKVSVSSSSKMGMKYESHSFPSASGGIELGIIILSDDLKMEELSGDGSSL